MNIIQELSELQTERDEYKAALEQIIESHFPTAPDLCRKALFGVHTIASEALRKRTNYYRQQQDDRTEWVREQPPRCMVCGSQQFLECHELASRAQAPGKSHFRASYLLVCRKCHEKVASIGHARLLAAKAIHDIDHYDREAVNLARGRDKDSVSEIDVIEKIIELTKHAGQRGVPAA